MRIAFICLSFCKIKTNRKFYNIGPRNNKALAAPMEDNSLQLVRIDDEGNLVL
jgi:hypothetical protein